MTANSKRKTSDSPDKNAAVTLPAVVQKIIPSIHPSDPDKAEIAVEGADHLYREIRVENRLQDSDGQDVALKPGAHVEVTIEAAPEGTVEKQNERKKGDVPSVRTHDKK
jgi:hypothetical protein